MARFVPRPRKTFLGVSGLVAALSVGCEEKPAPTRVGLPPTPAGAVILPGMELTYVDPTPTWLDDRRVLAVANEKGRRHTDGIVETQGEDHAYVVDTKTGARTVFRPLEAMFTRGPGRSVFGMKGAYALDRPARLLAAPGGRWILAMKTGEGEPWLALSTTGKPTRRWNVPDDAKGQPVWMKDGHRWVGVTRTGGFRLLVHDCENPKGDRSLPIERGTGPDEAWRTGWIAGTLGFLKDDRLLVKLGTPNGMRYVALRLEADRALADAFGHASEVDDIGSHEMAVSPDGTRVAYRSVRQTLSVSAPDGSGVVDLGPLNGPDAFAWSPDSKRLLMGARGVLWCVAAPSPRG